MKQFAKQIRIATLKELLNVGFGHYGGAMSIVEILAVLYGKHMKYDPTNPKDPSRDFFVLSKGHAGPALYAALALKGFFPLEMLSTLNKNGTKLPSHADCNLTAGVDMTTGSLGQGISAAAGIAYYHKVKNMNNKVFCIVGDGELNEGQCWEALQFAAHHKLKNFIIFIDNNKKQLDGKTEDISKTFDLVAKMQSFSLHSLMVDGRDIDAIDKAIEACYLSDTSSVIILDTIKGQGIQYLENKEDNHHIRPTKEDEIAIREAIAKLEEE